MTDGSHLMYHKLARYPYTSQGKQNENLHKIEWHRRARQEGDCDKGEQDTEKSYRRHAAAAELYRALKKNEPKFNTLICSVSFPHL